MNTPQPPDGEKAAKARAAATLARLLNNLWEQNPFNQINQPEEKRR